MRVYALLILIMLAKSQKSFNVALPVTLAEYNIETMLPLNDKQVYGTETNM